MNQFLNIRRIYTVNNNTLYASEWTYEFEKARIKGSNSAEILENVKREMDEPYPEVLKT